MYLVSLKLFVYPFIFGNIIHNGLTSSLSLQPRKYLNLNLPKETLLDTSVLLISTSAMKNKFLW